MHFLRYTCLKLPHRPQLELVMSPTRIRQYIAYLLIALLPLQAAAASPLALCAEMVTAGITDVKPAMPCKPISSMIQSSSTDTPASTHTGACWLGSICLAGHFLMPIPTAYAGIDVGHNSPTYLSEFTFYRSITSESPLRPPASLSNSHHVTRNSV